MLEDIKLSAIQDETIRKQIRQLLNLLEKQAADLRALGEFRATILFAGNLEGVTQTMPLAIYLGFERSLGVAVALSVVLLGVTRRLERKEQ